MLRYEEFDVVKAVKICCNAHDGQMYGNDPYFYHPMMVAYLVGHLGYDIRYIITAYLHDVVEDTSYKLEDINHHFGPEIFDAVNALTKRDKEEYQEYLNRVVKNEIAGVVKYCDLYHNHKISGRDTKKYREAFEFLSNNVKLIKKPMDYTLDKKDWAIYES